MNSYLPGLCAADTAALGGSERGALGTALGVVTVGTAVAPVLTVTPALRFAPARGGGPWPELVFVVPARWALELDAPAVLDFFPEPDPAHSGGAWPEFVLAAPAPCAVELDARAEFDPGPEPDPAQGGGPWPAGVLAAP